MSTFIRWLKFNTVGAMGFVLQLASLTIFHRLFGNHYLVASAAATELTLFHNFAWHMNYTWRDRRSGASPLRSFARFQLSNGLISLVGNLILVRVFVQQARLPVSLSNCFAILCCSFINFLIGHLWAFRAERVVISANTSRLGIWEHI